MTNSTLNTQHSTLQQALAAELHAELAELDRRGVPHTEFKYSEDTGQFAVIREQAGTFSDSIRLWSEA